MFKIINPEELRKIRLKNEYKSLMNLDGNIIHIQPIGEEPYSSYRVTFNIRTIISPVPAFRDKTVCLLTIPERFPVQAPRMTVCDESSPSPWHPNWYMSGVWDYGSWDARESLVNFLLRCAKTLQFNVNMTNIYSASNNEAVAFWEDNENNPDVIPSDYQRLPRY